MVKNKNGLSIEFIIHPGETLKEIIEDRGMSQRELSIRTGNSTKHISDIVNCLKPISIKFSKKLEYALGIDASFWINLQANYDKEIADFEELNHISEDELNILKVLKDIYNELVLEGFIKDTTSKDEKVIELRKCLNISSLESIPKIITTGAFRVSQSVKANPYVIFAWLRICELKTERLKVNKTLDVELLEGSIQKIKNLMFKEPKLFIPELERIFAECGIKFILMKHFKGAPVQGVITNNNDDTLSLIMTIRGAQADQFWFTLMHEIAHIINGDIKKKLIDYDDGESKQEVNADRLACSFLLDEEQYLSFINNNDFTLDSINSLAKKNKVKPFIVIGRLQKEGCLNWNKFSNEKVRYEWDKIV
jgi:HTH-type transcriptional regulator/antitoxin HigA